MNLYNDNWHSSLDGVDAWTEIMKQLGLGPCLRAETEWVKKGIGLISPTFYV